MEYAGIARIQLPQLNTIYKYEALTRKTMVNMVKGSRKGSRLTEHSNSSQIKSQKYEAKSA
jgi:hypothetical protein